MSGRIERRSYRLGTGEMSDPEYIAELDDRREKHERLTRGKPKRTFGEILDQRMRQGREDEPEDQGKDDEEEKNEALLGLAPNQEPSIANRTKRRSARVIIRG